MMKLSDFGFRLTFVVLSKVYWKLLDRGLKMNCNRIGDPFTALSGQRFDLSNATNH